MNTNCNTCRCLIAFLLYAILLSSCGIGSKLNAINETLRQQLGKGGDAK